MSKKPNTKPPRKPRKKAEKRQFIPYKIEGNIFGQWVNEKGEPIGEENVGTIKIFRPDFGSVAKEVAKLWPGVEKAVKGETETP